MRSSQIKKGFQKRGDWITKFTIGGESNGGWFDALNDIRISEFFESFPHAKTIIEFGSLEGGHTIALGQHLGVERVLGLEGRQSNIGKAEFVRDLLDMQNVAFMQVNLEAFDIASLGTFDAAFCSGLLYHLPAPWEFLDQMAKVTGKLFIWTHYADDEKATDTIQGYRGMKFIEGGPDDPLSGMSETSFWPAFDELVRMLADCGFPKVEIINKEPEHENGPCVTLAATAD